MKTPVLMLHHVEPRPLVPPPIHPDSYLSPTELGELLDLLRAGNYRTVTLAEAVRAAAAGEASNRSVVLTFDDGCRCFAEHAFPELSRRGMTATLFAVSGELGGTNRWDRDSGERQEALLDAGELGKLAVAGIEIGAHGRTHARLTECSAAQLTAEVAGAKGELEAALGRPVETFCYPYGHANGAVKAAAHAAGYRAAAGIEGHPGAADGDLYGIPRMILRPGDSRLELKLKVSGLYRHWRRLPRLGLLSTLRRARRSR